MMNHGMGIAPSFQPSVDVVLVGINERARDKSLFNQRLNGFLLDILQHLNAHIPPALNQAQDRRLDSPAKVPRPRPPLSRLRRPFRPFFSPW